jgi:hypothetical protein
MSNFVIHKHDDDYELSFGNDNLEFFNFKRTGLMATLSNNPNTTRLFGTKSEDTRSEAWMNFEGDTKDGIFEIVDSGKVDVVKEDNHYKLSFNGQNITGDWILRRIPNVFDKALFGENTFGWVLWKPGENPSEPAKFSDNDDLKDTQGRFNLDISLNQEEQTFEGIAAAEGTWVDMFGVPYMYTSEFIEKIAQEQQSKLAAGERIPLNTEHPNDELALDGDVTEVQLVREPINHIRVKGKYRGDTSLSKGEVGLSYEFRFRSVWNEEFQAWMPFDNITDKLSVVKRPACKICWITKVI